MRITGTVEIWIGDPVGLGFVVGKVGGEGDFENQGGNREFLFVEKGLISVVVDTKVKEVEGVEDAKLRALRRAS